MSNINEELLDNYDDLYNAIMQAYAYETRDLSEVNIAYFKELPRKEFYCLMERIFHVESAYGRAVSLDISHLEAWYLRRKFKQFEPRIKISKNITFKSLNLKYFYNKWISAGRRAMNNPELTLSDINAAYKKYTKRK